MSILEYVNHSPYLSQFGKHIILTEHDREKKFIEVLNNEYFKAIEVLANASYEKVLNRALDLEARIKTRKKKKKEKCKVNIKRCLDLIILVKGPGNKPILLLVCHLAIKVTHKYH